MAIPISKICAYIFKNGENLGWRTPLFVALCYYKLIGSKTSSNLSKRLDKQEVICWLYLKASNIFIIFVMLQSLHRYKCACSLVETSFEWRRDITSNTNQININQELLKALVNPNLYCSGKTTQLQISQCSTQNIDIQHFLKRTFSMQTCI